MHHVNKWFLVILLAASASLPSCASVKSSDDSSETFSVDQCEWAKFQEFNYEHMVYEIPQLFVLRELHGSFKNADNYWPFGTVLHVQLYRYGLSSAKPTEIEVSPQGEFGHDGLSSGRYCLKLSAPGWQTVLVAALVDPDSEYEDQLEIVATLAV